MEGTFGISGDGRTKALVIGNDAGGRENLRGLLAAAEIDLIEAGGGDGLKALFEERPDVVVLDLELPDADGIDVLCRIRELSDVPIVVLSGPGSQEGRVRALRSGADDCAIEPAGPELVARIEAVMRRPRQPGADERVLRDEFVLIDRLRHRVEVLGKEVALTPTEFRMLRAFAENPGRVLGHGQILDLVWGDRIRGTSEVKLYVSYLRRKLDGAAGVDPVETVRGVGYRYRPRLREKSEKTGE